MSEQPFNVDPVPSSICSTGLRLNTVQGILLGLLRSHFSQANYIFDPRLRDYIWSNDETVSRILIAPDWHWKTPGQQRRPAVVTRRSALRLGKVAIGDGASLVGGPSPVLVPANGSPTMMLSFVGGYTVSARAIEPAQAELLADEVARRLYQFQQVIRSDFGFSDFRVTSIDETSKVEEASEYFSVPIRIEYAYHETWEIVTEAPFLKRIVLEAE